MNNTLLFAFLAISITLTAQIERPKWEFGGGVRLNYMGLDGGMSGYRNDDGYSFDLNYKDIGMDNYSPSFAIALGGRYKKWNLEFGGSRGTYEGSFVTLTDITRDDAQIDSGSVVSGSLDLNMYALSTHFGLIQRKHDLGLGIGFLVLEMGSNYHTTDQYGTEVKLGEDQWFPMPFLAISGRLKFNDFRIVAMGGGAIFKGERDNVEYDVSYLTIDVSAAYDFLKLERLTFAADLGYRCLFLDMKVENDIGWYKEEDIYLGPYASIRVLFSSKEMWKFVRNKDRKKESGDE